MSDGGLYSILYEDHPDRGYVGHRFIIKEITGNRFKMEYVGLESTFSIASSAFGIGNDMYFRKDSFFHYWLARPEQDDFYHNYANQKRIFLFFGKIWPVSNESNTYSIEFEGMKDFTLKGIPEHNQTVNMTEWLKVYWDQIHHEMYNMTKTFWSMNDAREIDIRWLAYIAGIYGIEISEEILKELSLREWVENLPSFLKRIGTYNALYIIWKVFLSNTKNHLNVYERWGEWCTQGLDIEFGNLVDEFEDHHILEFYETQPSGGAGDYYYSRFNPINYPVHTIDAPIGDCGIFKWDTGIGENYILLNNHNLNCAVGDIKEKEVNITGYDPTRTTLQAMFLSASSPQYIGDFSHSIGIEMGVSAISPSNVVCWAVSNETSQMFDHTGNYLSLSYEISGGQRYFKLVERYSGSNSSISTSGSYIVDTPYYVIIDRTGLNLRARVYDRNRKWSQDLLETITLPLSGSDSYSNLYVLNGRRISGHNLWYGKLYGLSTDANFIPSIAISGAPVITPHYKVQIDLSTEPLGDIFNDSSIISEGVVNELVRNFEYVRPVSKYSHYEELISPVASIDRVGASVPLYSLTSNGYMNTFFTGSQFISAGGDGLGLNTTFSYFQQFASKTWTISHNLNSSFILVQPWIFTSSTSQGAKLVRPNVVNKIDENTVQLTFNESVRGVAAIAASGDFGVTFIEEDYILSPSITWNIDHNLDTNTPSGYTSPPGPVVFIWDNNNERVIPDINDLANNNLLATTWTSASSGGAIVRRSDYIHTQNDPSTSWNVNHNLNAWVIVQCYDITTGEEIIPKDIIITDSNNLNIKWDSNTRGYAHIIQVIRDNVIYSPYDCDLLGIGICPNVLGYWKVGTGESTLWNPFIQNDLESPATSGVFKAIEQDDNNVYVDFIVPSEFDDISIKEIGLFNYLDQMVLYSRCSELHKPNGVQCFFHYRIGKLGSSSSSSSSSSVSSSSSSSSNSST